MDEQELKDYLAMIETFQEENNPINIISYENKNKQQFSM